MNRQAQNDSGIERNVNSPGANPDVTENYPDLHSNPIR